MPTLADSSIDLSRLQDRAAQLVEATLKCGATGADAIVASGRSQSVDVRLGKIEESDSSENDAFTLRAFVGDKIASVTANQTSDPHHLAEKAVAMAKVSPPNPYAALVDRADLATDVAELDLIDNNWFGFDELTEFAGICESSALSVKDVTNSNGASFSQSLSGTVLATSEGFTGGYLSSRYSASVSVVAGEGEAMERDYDFDSQHHFEDLKSLEEIGKIAANRSINRLNPKSVSSQTATIVFEPRTARSLLSHLASAVSGASIARNTSFLSQSKGERIFNDQVSIVDEPQILRAAGSRPFDADGIAPATLNLVERGFLCNWLLDTASARELGLKTNGRANRTGSATSPGTTNLSMVPGAITRDDMISSIKSGFYVTELIGQGVNLVTGDYSRGASGFWIENGELTHAVTGVTIAGNLADMFLNLSPASDLDKRNAVNAPTIRVEGMTLASQ